MRRTTPLLLIISVLFITLFGYAAITKLSDFWNFRFGLSESPFISPFAAILAWLIPVSELIIIILLIVPFFRLTGFYASFSLMFLFTAYIAAMLVSGSEIPCSCGGILEKMSWPAHLVFNGVFVLLGAAGILLERKRRKINMINSTNKPLAYAKKYP